MSAPAKDKRDAAGSPRTAGRKNRNPWKSLTLAIGALLALACVAVAVLVINQFSDEVPTSMDQPVPTSVPMPNLFGMRADDAVAQLWTLARVRADHYGTANGLVNGQEIAPGQTIRSYSDLDLYTTDMPMAMQRSTVSHQTHHAGVNLDAPMAGSYDSTFKVASKMWLQDHNGNRARGFCSSTYRIMYDTSNTIGGILGASSSKYQELVQNTAQLSVACDDVQELYGSGRWPGISG